MNTYNFQNKMFSTLKYSWLAKSFTLVVLSLLLATSTHGVQLDIASQAWPEATASPETKQILEIIVTIEKGIEVGESDGGVRRLIPITGGYFRGENIKGKVLNGGADWQLQRPDGVLEIDALYAIQTDDGAHIIIHNQGIVVSPEVGSSAPYIRTTPKFHAPKGKYDWLNKRIFTGSIAGVDNGQAVIIRVFQVD